MSLPKQSITVFLGLVIAMGLLLSAWNLNDASELADNETIVLGQTAPLSGPNKHLGINFHKGASAYFDFVNALGGIYGRAVDIALLDDKYEPKIAESNTSELIKKGKVFALFGLVGTPTTAAALPIALKANIPFLTPLTGAQFLRNQPQGEIFNIRPSYAQETEAIASYLIQERGIKKIAIFYQNDSYGIEGLESLSRALKKYGISIVAEGSYNRNTLSISDAIFELKAKKPDAIVLFGAYQPSAKFIQRFRTDCQLGESTIFISASFVGSCALANALEGNMSNVLVSNILPSPWDDSHPLAQEYREIYINNNHGEPNYLSFEGFVAAKLVTQALRACGKKLTRKRFIKELSAITPEQYVYITSFEKGKFQTLKRYP